MKSTPEHRPLNRAFPVVLFTMASTLLACSDEGTGRPAGVADGPLYAISTIVFSPDFSSAEEHIAFSDSLEAGGNVNASMSLEINGENSSIWPSYQLGEFFLADAATGQLIRYKTAPDGSITQDKKLSFSAYGVNALYWNLMAVHSSTKAFMIDELTLQGFVWNPSEMTITSNVDLSSSFSTDSGGKKYTVWRERVPIRIGDRYFASFTYFDPASQSVLPRSGMIIMDAATDKISVVEHPSCGGLLSSVVGADGNIYSSTGLPGAAAFHLQQAGVTAPCLTRFEPATMTFDLAATKTDIGALVGPGRVAGGLVGVNGGAAYLQVLNATLIPQGFTPAPLTLTGSKVWETYRIDDITNPTKLTKMDMPVVGGVVFPFSIDGHSYVSDVDHPNSKSLIWDLSTDPPKPGIELPGWGYIAVRVR